jgi:general secretion pathway protein F
MGVFFRSLQMLTQSGVVIGAACREMARQAPRNLRGLAEEMGQAADAGDPITTALERHRGLLYPWHIGILRAAEAGGFLPDAFDEIARAYETEWETRASLRPRLFFYVFLGLPAMLLVLPVVLYLRQPIPDFDQWDTQYVIDGLLGRFYAVSLPILIGIVVALVVWRLLSATSWFQGLQQRIVLRLPVVGRLARATALERYLSVMGLMLRGGLPIAEAAEHGAHASGHAVLMPRLLEIVPMLREGIPLSQAVGAIGVLDADTLGMAATGEASGALPEMLTQAATYYRKDNDAARRMLLRAAGIAIGVVWACLAGALFITQVVSYFDFLFRAGDKMWMEQ